MARFAASDLLFVSNTVERAEDGVSSFCFEYIPNFLSFHLSLSVSPLCMSAVYVSLSIYLSARIYTRLSFLLGRRSLRSLSYRLSHAADVTAAVCLILT